MGSWHHWKKLWGDPLLNFIFFMIWINLINFIFFMIWPQKVNYDCDATATTCETRQANPNIKTHTQFVIHNPTQSVISHMLFLFVCIFPFGENIWNLSFPLSKTFPQVIERVAWIWGIAFAFVIPQVPAHCCGNEDVFAVYGPFFAYKIWTFDKNSLQTWKPSNGLHQPNFQPLEICKRKTCKLGL